MKNVKIGICGFGKVGKAFMELIIKKREQLREENINIELKYIFDYKGYLKLNNMDFDRNIENNKGFVLGGRVEDAIKDREVDVMIITTPTNKETGEPAYSIIKYLLNNKVNIVTADKGPIMLAYNELLTAANRNDVQLWFGCTVGGALPSINGGKMDLAGASITEISGVLNGTTNYILGIMQREKIEYPEALKRAQKAGIAETDPSLDVEGWDSAIKLLILTNALMNVNKGLSDVEVEGITELRYEDIKTQEIEGRRYKLVCVSRIIDEDVIMKVEPRTVNEEHPFYNVADKNKCVRFKSDTMGDLIMIGGASGLEPAAAALLRDLINFSRGYKFK